MSSKDVLPMKWYKSHPSLVSELNFDVNSHAKVFVGGLWLRGGRNRRFASLEKRKTFVDDLNFRVGGGALALEAGSHGSSTGP
jgi:hypothetical protein